jgi:RNA polymerase sigma-70 factor (ECF subfamily)
LNDLIVEIKNDDQNAFKEFFYLMQPSVFHFLLRFTSDRIIAEDLTQETFIKFWLNRKEIQPNSFPKAYIFQIARNLAINHIHRSYKTESIDDSIKLSALINDSEKEMEYIFFRDDCQKAIDVLPERCKTTFLLSRYHGFNYSEIADIMQVSLQTVKNQMNKAISVLKKRLSNYLY